MKFSTFANFDMKSAKAREFVTLEDWVNGGVPISRCGGAGMPVQLVFYNTQKRGHWLVDGITVIAEAIMQPSLVVVPKRDTIAPPASAMPLAEALTNGRSITLPAGHIGMVAGSAAKRGLYRHLGAWLTKVSS